MDYKYISDEDQQNLVNGILMQAESDHLRTVIAIESATGDTKNKLQAEATKLEDQIKKIEQKYPNEAKARADEVKKPKDN